MSLWHDFSSRFHSIAVLVAPVRSLPMDKSSLHSPFFSSKVRTLLWLAATATLFAGTAAAQPLAGAHSQLLQLVDKDAAHWQQVSKQIWDFAELGYHETKSSDLLQEQLKAAGFKVQGGVANEPTAFIASYGEGKPEVAILGEFDALPGLSQQTVPTRHPVKAGAPGHGCGHNLLGAARRWRPSRSSNIWRRTTSRAHCATTALRQKRVVRARCTWCAMARSRMWTWCCTGIRATAMRSAAAASWPWFRPSSRFMGWQRTRPWLRLAVARRSTPSC